MLLRSILATAALAAAFAAHAQGDPKVLRVVPHSNLAILDPHWTTAYMSRNHGYMIYDTLFGTDDKNQIKPQMVESWTVSPDNRLWTFKLRSGLAFHDGAPVTGDDVIASRLPQRASEAVTSSPVTGAPSWNARPLRSLKVHRRLSGDTVQDSTICGLIWFLSSVPKSVS